MTQVTIEGDRLCADSLCVRDPELVRFVAEHEDADRPALVERALRVGLIALANAGVTVNVDAVQREFAALLERMDRSNEAASEALTTTLRDNFADADGRLPRTLDRFLGERGELRRLTAELFDPERRDSAIGRIRTLLGTYFDGDGALLAQLLDPAREGSPLHGFRDEMREGLERVAERLSNLEAARTARAEERARGTAKGGDFEDHVGHRLAPLARCWGDLLEHTGTTVGAGVRAKTGDYVLQLDPSWTRGVEVRVAIEAKDRRLGLTALARELDGARRNRGAAVAVAVFAPGLAPAGCAPLTLHGQDVICELDPDDPEAPGFEAAIRLARALALVASRQRPATVDVSAVTGQLESVRNRLREIQGMKTKLTSMKGVADDVACALDGLRAGVLDCVIAIEAELATAACADDEAA
ncbi:MAG: hypothetical protein E6I76_06065 [Chloroflexi bacterium]|nr:MAG: hypothetical protein E6I76_06065 [Chloroflexota bacterium]